jgi:hypothetical protein
MKVGDGSLGSHEAEGVGGEGFYITQSGRRVDLSGTGSEPLHRKGMLSLASGVLTLSPGQSGGCSS